MANYGISVFSVDPKRLAAKIAQAKSDIVARAVGDGVMISERDLVTWQLVPPDSTPAYVWLPSPTHPWGDRSLVQNIARWIGDAEATLARLYE
ncbi:MAG: hypothetical protein E3J64_06055 [Anaerolineales bacterium]|nr:MAG: hypothetical protein E3J64_06055 [Anaerolineales bacterium]